MKLVLLIASITLAQSCQDIIDKGTSIGTEIGVYFMEKCCYPGLKCGHQKDIAVLHEQVFACFTSEQFLGFKLSKFPLDLPATAKKVQKDCHPDGQSRDYCKQPDRDKMVPCLRNKWAPLLVPQLMGLAAEHCGHVSQLMDHIYPKRMHMAKEFVDAYCGWVKGGRNGKLPKFDCSKYKFQPF